jgi:hypothetical protein
MKRFITPLFAILAGIAVTQTLQALGASWWGSRIGGLAAVVLVLVLNWRKKARA